MSAQTSRNPARSKMSHEVKTASDRALACEAAGDLPGALDAWQAALAAEPSSLDIVARLADLAFRLGFFDMAEQFYAHLITRGAQGSEVISAFSACLREQGRYDEAIELLKSALGGAPETASLWEALGAVLAAKGDNDTALIFFNEALRLKPDHLNARFHRGCALIELGQVRAGLEDTAACAEAFSDPSNRASAEMTCAYAALALGELEAGWRWYEGRHRRGTPQEVRYEIPLPRHSGPAKGRLFLSAEQGLGDEVLYASLIPEILKRASHLGIGVEPRLVPLFARSFPEATVVAHRTRTIDGRTQRTFDGCDWQAFDSWALMGDFLAPLRPALGAFPAENAFLKPDPTRVDHWRNRLSSGKPSVGILWKSLKSNALRDRFFSPFRQWHQVLSMPGIRFVNLQYGDTEAEMAEARARGFDVITPDGIDLKQDLDDLAALCCACDLVIGPSNATTNIAGACGADLWLLTPPDTWLRLGADNYPWYPKARLFAPPTLADWSPAMADIRAALEKAF
jgi:hypothetical protein